MHYTELPALPEPQDPEHAAAQDLARAADRLDCSCSSGQYMRLSLARGVAAALDSLDAHAPKAADVDTISTEALWAQAIRSAKVRALAEQMLIDVLADGEVSSNTACVLLDVALDGVGDQREDSRFVEGFEWTGVNPHWAPFVVSTSDHSEEKL